MSRLRHLWQRPGLVRPLAMFLLALFCLLTAQGTGIRLFVHLFYLLLALLVLSFAWAWLNLRGLQVRREASVQRAQVGELVQERLLIENRWPFPRLWIEVQDHSDLPQHGGGLVTYLPAFARRRWTSRTACTLRGKFHLGPATLISGDPFGIFRLERPHGDANEVVVYPQTVPLARFALPNASLSGGRELRGRSPQVTASVAGVREYAYGDSLNRIHWRSTARAGRLIAKEFEHDPSAEVYVLLDMERRAHLLPGEDASGGELRDAESTEEYAVTAAASLARHLLDGSRSLGLIAWGQHHESLNPEREQRQLLKILEALAVLRAHGNQPLAELLLAESSRFSRSSTLLIVTPSLDERWVASVQQLIYRGVRAAVVLVDQGSFGGQGDVSAIQGKLAMLLVPCYLLRRGQGIAEALQAY